MAKFLSLEQRRTETWNGVVAHLEERLQELRVANDSDSGEVKTAFHRGRIAEVRALLSENDPISRDGEGVDYANP